MLATGNNQQGFSLAELMIYIGVIVLVFLMTGSFIIEVSKNNKHTQAKQQLQTQTSSVMQYVTHAVHHAATISKPTPESLELVSHSQQGNQTHTRFEIRDNKLYVGISMDDTFEPSEWQQLTSNEATATLDTAITHDMSVHVAISLSQEQTTHSIATTIANRQPLQ